MNTRPRPESTEQQTLVKVIGFLCILSAPLWVYGLFFPFPSNFPIENKLPALVLVLVVVLAVQVILIGRMTAGDHFMAQVMIVGFLLKLAAVSAYMFMAVRFYGIADLFFYFESGLRIVDKFSLKGAGVGSVTSFAGARAVTSAAKAGFKLNYFINFIIGSVEPDAGTF